MTIEKPETSPDRRLAASIRRNREPLVEQLSELPWASPTEDRALISGPDRVRPRVEAFLDVLVTGLEHGDWSRFDEGFATRTLELLRAGTVSADQLNARAATIAAILLPYVAGDGTDTEALMALFKTMQSLSTGIVARHNEGLLDDSRRLGDVQAMFLRLTGHELQGPLGTIRGYASMLSDGDFGPMPEPARSAVAAMDRSAGEALDLIEGLVEVGRLEAPGDVLHRRPIKLSELVQTVADGLASTAAERSMQIEVAASDAEAVVDVARCSVAIRNLVANAIKYGPAGSRIRISARKEGDMAAIEVSDEGPGIPAPESERIFERYYRLERTRQARQPGSGLGLYIVKRIAELHGGSADVVSKPGEGATFRLRLAEA